MSQIVLPLIGGILIGLATSLILLGLGRITGISGILASSILSSPKNTEHWKYFFITGLLAGGFIMKFFYPDFFNYTLDSSVALTIGAGLLVGVGTRLGSGCTSGHGVCGLPRKSLRSFIATLTFMLFGVLSVYIKGFL